MHWFQLNVHADLYHYKDKKTLHGTAKTCVGFVPQIGMHIGPDRVLTVCRVDWLGGHEFDVYTEALSVANESVRNAQFERFGLPPFPDRWDDRAAMRAAVDKILWLKFTWREEGDDDDRPDGERPPPAGGGDQPGPGQP